MRVLTFVLALFAAAAVPAAAQRAVVPGPAFDKLIDSTIALWKVPGVAIAIVKGDRVLLAKGYGIKDLANRAPVTENTKFAIGSVTKSFTATALAAQVGQKKLTWDAKVRDLMPGFRLQDEVASRDMTVRDLLSHRSGLPRHDLMWYGSPLSRQEIFDRLRYLEPNREFRSYWQYQNLMFLTAGMLSGQLNGTSWEDAVRQLVFEPLGMATADISVDALQRSADFSYGHNKSSTDSVWRMPFRNIDQIGPAGSINATVAEMARYLVMHMRGGSYGGKSIIGPAEAREMQSQQMVISGGGGTATPPSSRWTEVAPQQYGLAFFLGNYRGHRLVHHGGNIDGFSAELSFLPDDSVGVVVLTNMNGTPTRDFIPLMVYDRLLGLAPIDWNARYKEQEAWGRARQAEALARRTAERKGTSPAHAPAEYAGVYSHPAYGDMTITNGDSGLRLKFNSVDLPLEPFHFETFATPSGEGATGPSWRVDFQVDGRGVVNAIAVPVEAAVKPIVFVRKAGAGR